MKTKCYALGDVHGRLRALKQVLTDSEFDFEEDKLITLGDICDGGRNTRECFDLLLQVQNRVDVKGNHDGDWFLNWINTGVELPIWTFQGGYNTLESYDFDRRNVPRAHKEFVENALPYYVDRKKNLFVHGGFNPLVPIENQKPYFLFWDRTILKYARTHKIPGYKHVFVGHTSTQAIKPGVTTPITMHNLTMCDCGGGWSGRLALVNVDTFEYFVSDIQRPSWDEKETLETLDESTEEYSWVDSSERHKMPDFSFGSLSR